MLLIPLVCSPLYLLGVLLFVATRSGKVPEWLRWWRPLTKKINNLIIDDNYSHAERVGIDGLSFLVFAAILTFSFILIFLIIDCINISELWIGLITVLILLLSRRLNDYVVLKIMTRFQLIRKEK